MLPMMDVQDRLVVGVQPPATVGIGEQRRHLQQGCRVVDPLCRRTVLEWLALHL
jgi:hypothetical protein